jgi:membrane protein
MTSEPPGRKHPKEFASSDQPGDIEVRISLISQRWNEALTGFFAATTERTRLYWLLVSLARHQSVRTANAMAFDLFLALVPMLGLAGWTASIALRDGPGDLSTSALLRDMTPTQVDQFIGQHLSAMSAVHLAPFAGLAGWWLVSSSFNTMIGVFQETFACSPRNWVHTRLLSLAFALLAMLFIGGFFGLGVIVALAPGEIVRPVLDSLRYFGLLQASLVVVSLLGAASFLALLYRYSIRRPDRKRHVWPGAFTATFLGTLASRST